VLGRIHELGERRRLRRRIASVPFWWHSLDLGQGVVTEGAKRADHLRGEVESFRFPDLRGKSFLDIGAWDGFFSFEAERRGATRVVALDHYVWSWKPRPNLARESLPDKKRGIEIAREALGSDVEVLVADFMTMDLDQLGEFDVVLFAGVLYHLLNPLEGLRRLAQVTRELAIVETEAIAVPELEDRAMFEFFENDELGGDPTNWWSPNAVALAGLCRTAGFGTVSVLNAPPGQGTTSELQRYRLVAHASMEPASAR